MSFIPLFLAKYYRVKNRIAHCHGYRRDELLKNKIINKIFSILVKKSANYYFYCSKEAGYWLFGKNIETQKNAFLIKNAINLKEYVFNELTKNRIRELYSLKDALVLAHIGRFSPEKNQSFTIDVFNEILKINKDSKLLLIGDCSEDLEIRRKVNMLEIQDSVLFLGPSTIVNELLSAIDIVLMPSLNEGLGIVAIEAQAAGVQCFVSKNCSLELSITNKITYLDLNKGPIYWRDAIINSNYLDRKEDINSLIDHGYDLQVEALKLENLYLNMNNI